MLIFLSALMMALLVWIVFCERRREKEIPKVSFNRAVRAVWVQELERD